MYFFLFFLFYCFFNLFLFYTFFCGSFFLDFYFFSFGSIDLSLSFVFDFLSLGFFSCVSLISSVVFFYSIFYMGGTIDSRRFSWLVFLFVFSMFLLVFSGNFVSTMVGWDGLGLVSFCLVIFYVNSSSLESGLVTVFSNRVGDVFFLLSFLFFFVGGVFIWDLFSFCSYSLFVVLIFLGAITKSAQVPFSAWLPAAMAAPTPVSSLVHSSTLVTAGVYVLIRFNYLFFFFSYSFFKFFFVMTMVGGGFCAVIETDLKKVVAMSTLSQLGMMMFILSVGSWFLSFIHMVVHAFFKSMLFLSTGSLMGQMEGSQDSRFYGGSLFSYGTFLFFVVSCMCLSGFPFFVGFYSKDFIISSVSFYKGVSLFYIFIIGCVLTVSYSVRLVHVTYVLRVKFIPFFDFKESASFFHPVLLLFFNCWLVGGVLSWVFLSDLKFFFSFYDLLLGIFILLGGLVAFFFLRLSLFFVNFFSSVLFLRWGFSGGSTRYLSSFYLYKYETTWMEISGGAGTFYFLSFLNNRLHFLGLVNVGSLVFVSMLFGYYFFY